jgi:hypothetical protein
MKPRRAPRATEFLRASLFVPMLASSAAGQEAEADGHLLEEARVHIPGPPPDRTYLVGYATLFVTGVLVVCMIVETVRRWNRPSGMRRHARWRGHDPGEPGA